MCIRDRICDELRDPRLTLISMTSVDVSRDLAHARVYVTLLGDPAERAERVAELNHAAPLLRRELGRRMHIPVSYTHLDVYKRQLIMTARAPWFSNEH